MGMAFARLEEGYENAMKDYYKKQVAQLKTLITMLIGQLSKGDRQKIMTICTIDVHARDVVAKMIAQKVSPGLSRVPFSVGTYTTSIGVWERLMAKTQGPQTLHQPGIWERTKVAAPPLNPQQKSIIQVAHAFCVILGGVLLP